jgi:hypothetical protein
MRLLQGAASAVYTDGPQSIVVADERVRAPHPLPRITMSSSSSAHANTSASPNATPSLPISLDGDAASLNTALAPTSGDDESELSGPELDALLAQLARADGLAAGVEGRLDALIGELDAFLAGLGAEEGEPATEEGAVAPADDAAQTSVSHSTNLDG